MCVVGLEFWQRSHHRKPGGAGPPFRESQGNQPVGTGTNARETWLGFGGDAFAFWLRRCHNLCLQTLPWSSLNADPCCSKICSHGSVGVSISDLGFDLTWVSIYCCRPRACVAGQGCGRLAHRSHPCFLVFFRCLCLTLTNWRRCLPCMCVYGIPVHFVLKSFSPEGWHAGYFFYNISSVK